MCCQLLGSLVKAYDRVWRRGLYYKMEKYGLGGKTLDLIKSMYRNDIIFMIFGCDLYSLLLCESNCEFGCDFIKEHTSGRRILKLNLFNMIVKCSIIEPYKNHIKLYILFA